MARKKRTPGWNPEDMAALRERLIALRESQQKSQKEVAEDLDIGLQYLRRLEGGKSALTLTMIRRMARLYDVFPASLFAMLGVEEFNWLPVRLTRSPKETGTDPFKDLSDEERDELVSYLLYLRLKKGVAAAVLPTQQPGRV